MKKRLLIALTLVLVNFVNGVSAKGGRAGQITEDSVASFQIGKKTYIADKFSSSARLSITTYFRAPPDAFLSINLEGKTGRGRRKNSNSLSFSFLNPEFDKEYKLFTFFHDPNLEREEFAYVNFHDFLKVKKQLATAVIDPDSEIKGFIKFTEGTYDENTQEGLIIGEFNIDTNLLFDTFRPIRKPLKIKRGRIFIKYRVFINDDDFRKKPSKNRRLADLVSNKRAEIQSVEMESF